MGRSGAHLTQGFSHCSLDQNLSQVEPIFRARVFVSRWRSDLGDLGCGCGDPPTAATGGEVTYVGGKTVHTFKCESLGDCNNAAETFTFEVIQGGTFEYLVVAGARQDSVED